MGKIQNEFSDTSYDGTSASGYDSEASSVDLDISKPPEYALYDPNMPTNQQQTIFKGTKDSEMDIKVVNAYLASSKKPVFTEWSGICSELSHDNKPSINSYYMIMNAVENFQLGGFFPGERTFFVELMDRTRSEVTVEGGKIPHVKIITSFYYHEEKSQTIPFFLQDELGFRFFNLVAPGTVFKILMKISPMGDSDLSIKAVSFVHPGCGIICLKYNDETAYIFLAHKNTIQNKSRWIYLSPELNTFRYKEVTIMLKNMLKASKQIRTYGIDAGYRCYFMPTISDPYQRSVYLVNTRGFKSFTKLVYYRPVSESSTVVSVGFRGDNILCVYFQNRYGQTFGVTEFKRGEATPGSNSISLAPNSAPHELEIVAPGASAVVENSSSFGYLTNTKFSDNEQSLSVKFVAPDGFPIF